jgi:hypothetical protein
MGLLLRPMVMETPSIHGARDHRRQGCHLGLTGEALN